VFHQHLRVSAGLSGSVRARELGRAAERMGTVSHRSLCDPERTASRTLVKTVANLLYIEMIFR
jgi:hypothetical protein